MLSVPAEDQHADDDAMTPGKDPEDSERIAKQGIRHLNSQLPPGDRPMAKGHSTGSNFFRVILWLLFIPSEFMTVVGYPMEAYYRDQEHRMWMSKHDTALTMGESRESYDSRLLYEFRRDLVSDLPQSDRHLRSSLSPPASSGDTILNVSELGLVSPELSGTIGQQTLFDDVLSAKLGMALYRDHPLLGRFGPFADLVLNLFEPFGFWIALN